MLRASPARGAGAPTARAKAADRRPPAPRGRPPPPGPRAPRASPPPARPAPRPPAPSSARPSRCAEARPGSRRGRRPPRCPRRRMRDAAGVSRTAPKTWRTAPGSAALHHAARPRARNQADRVLVRQPALAAQHHHGGLAGQPGLTPPGELRERRPDDADLARPPASCAQTRRVFRAQGERGRDPPHRLRPPTAPAAAPPRRAPSLASQGSAAAVSAQRSLSTFWARSTTGTPRAQRRLRLGERLELLGMDQVEALRRRAAGRVHLPPHGGQRCRAMDSGLRSPGPSAAAAGGPARPGTSRGSHQPASSAATRRVERAGRPEPPGWAGSPPRPAPPACCAAGPGRRRRGARAPSWPRGGGSVDSSAFKARMTFSRPVFRPF